MITLDDGNLAIFIIIIGWDIYKHHELIRGFISCEVNDFLSTDGPTILFGDVLCTCNNLIVAFQSKLLINELYEC